MSCKHKRLKVRKHRDNPYPCLHCLEKSCTATWSDSIRILYFLQKFKEINGVLK